MSEVFHDTVRHAAAGAFGVLVPGCPACDLLLPARPKARPGACVEQVAELGFQEGHEWSGYGQVFKFEGKRSETVLCKRCGEIGWRISDE